jgi:hypothetical protein
MGSFVNQRNSFSRPKSCRNADIRGTGQSKSKYTPPNRPSFPVTAAEMMRWSEREAQCRTLQAK